MSYLQLVPDLAPTTTDRSRHSGQGDVLICIRVILASSAVQCWH